MSAYCERCDTEVEKLGDLQDRGDGIVWCWECIDNYDPTPWEVSSEDNLPRDEAHRSQEARLLK